ncbi:Clp1-domain-containing protein [Exidia glandulosa HHB12029]|uniref:Polynucleotide 5'-hydroxyl-kinase GRC3 n=1 Tax=Exidia glandulosa HHB12029 TaxID=1314781 RepID=A0A165DWH0_EXIGL|nr:Clp1-domain-containing protein [Exidia glandulosa HHB12029]
MEPKEWLLQPESEYRFELDPGTSLAITVVRGTAEVFGAELAPGRTYLFGHECKAAIFTWEGCTLEVRGRPSTEYVSDETNMWTCANLHVMFEKMRIRARRAQRGSPPPDGRTDTPSEPPRVLVLGQENSGKTSICKILTNYAVRTGVARSPVVVNMDPGEGAWTIPGTLSACPISDPIPTSTPAHPFGTTATSAPTTTTSAALVPVTFWFGHMETKRNPKLMDRLIKRLAIGVDARIEHDPIAKISGVIIDTPANFAAAASNTGPTDVKHPMVKACVDEFRVNHILVIGNEKLYVEMQRMFRGSGMNVIKIPKSGGVVELDYAYRDRMHNQQLRAYMYGTQIELPPSVSESSLGGEALHDLTLSPHSTSISFDDLKIFRVGGTDSMAPSSALPIGAGRMISEVQPMAVDPSMPGSGLLNAVLALLAPAPANASSEDVLADRNVAGFVIITGIDIPGRKMTILAPVTGSLAGRTALVGTLEWQDS